MGREYKRLGSTVVVANTDTELYETPASTEAVISSIVVCNTGSDDRIFRIAYVDDTAVGSVSTEDYLYYNQPILANDTFIVTAGITMAPEHIILVRADHAEVVFSVFGSEIS